MINCTDCEKEAAVNLGEFPFCLTCAHGVIDKAAVYHQAKRHEAETRIAASRAIRGFKVRTPAPALAAAM